MPSRRIVIGIIGGIGSGKSFVTSLFAEEGARVIDADRFARRVLRTPSTLRRIRAAFGPDMFGPRGRLDRKRLADVAFRNRTRLGKLNRIIHPQVIRLMRAELKRRTGGIVVLDVPLLMETRVRSWCDRIVFVDAPRRVREARVRGRGWSAAELRRREAMQTPLAHKRKMADFVIPNRGSRRKTRASVRRFLRSLA